LKVLTELGEVQSEVDAMRQSGQANVKL
jgi:hypothetical protein